MLRFAGSGYEALNATCIQVSATMKTETRQINKWSGKREGKPSNRKRIVQQTQEGVENVANDPSSPKIAAVNPQTESSINSLPAMAPKTPNTVLSPATVRSSQKSYVESSSGDDVGSTRSSSSQTQHQPSSLSNDDRSFQELRDASASIRNLQALLWVLSLASHTNVTLWIACAEVFCLKWLCKQMKKAIPNTLRVSIF